MKSRLTDEYRDPGGHAIRFMCSKHYEKTTTLQQLTDRANFVVSAKRDPVFGPILIAQRRPVKASFATDSWNLGAFRDVFFLNGTPTSALEGHLWARVSDSGSSGACRPMLHRSSAYWNGAAGVAIVSD